MSDDCPGCKNGEHAAQNIYGNCLCCGELVVSVPGRMGLPPIVEKEDK